MPFRYGSQYLTSRIENSAHITIRTESEIVALDREPFLKDVTWEKAKGGRMASDIATVFVMIRAKPNTGWLLGSARLDNKGFVLTGGAVGFEEGSYTTSMQGI